MIIKPEQLLDNLPDAELARLAALRDDDAAARRARAAFLVLHDRYAARLVSYLAARRPSYVAVDDLHQTVWLKVWEHVGTFDGAHFSGWIFKIAHNVVIEQFRRRGTLSTGLVDDVMADPRGIDSSDRLIRDEEQTQLARCLELLKPEERLVIVARLSGEDYASITAQSAIPANRAYRLFFDGMAKLKSCVERAGQ